MKKAATSARVGRHAQAARAAAARRSVRLAKSRAGRGAVVAALGAGLLLHGGQATASAEVVVRPVAVTVLAADDPHESGSDGEGDSEQGDSEQGDSEQGDAEQADPDGSDADGSSTEDRASDDVDTSDGEQGDGEQGDGEQGDGEQGDGEQGDGEQGDGEQGDGEQGDGTAVSQDPGASRSDDAATPSAPGPAPVPTPSVTTSPAARPVVAPRAGGAPGTSALATSPVPAGVPWAGSRGLDPLAALRDASARRDAGLDRAVIAVRSAVGPTARPADAGGRTSDAAAQSPVAQSPVARFVLALVGLGPHSADGAPAPIAPSAALVLAQWAFFRRGENPLVNRSPVAPGQTGAATTGHVVATDPDGDELTYELLEGPSRGSVTVAADGSYVYVPDAELARTGGTDTFTVAVRDNDPTAPGLGRYTDLVRTALARSHPALAARLFGAHTAVATVTVQVPATTSPAPPRVVVDPSTGTVTGRVGPDDGVPRTYTVTTEPRFGTLRFDDDGTYTYVPSAEARRAAARTPGPDVDTFTVVVTDGADVATARTVTLFAAEAGTEYSGTLPISEVVTGERVTVGANPSGVVVSPDGRFVAVRGYGDDTVTVYDTRDGSSYQVSTDGSPDQVVFSPDGTRLFVLDARDIGDPDDPFDPDDPVVPGTNGAFVHVVDLENDVVLTVVPLDDVTGTLQTGPDGRYAYVAVPAAAATGFPGMPGTPATPAGVVVIDTAGPDRDVRMLAEGDFTNGFQRSPDGTRAYAVDQTTGRVVVVDTASAAVVHSAEAGTGVSEVAFSPDGTRAYTVDQTGAVVVFDVARDTSRSLGVVPGAGFIDERNFSPDGRHLTVADYGGNRVTVIDVGEDRVVTVPADSPSEVTYAPGGRLAYVGAYRDEGPGVVTAVDLANGTATPITVGTGYRDVAFSPDGARAYVTTWDGTVTVIDTATATVVGTIAVPDRSGAIRLSPDGTRAYVTSTNESGPEEDETGDLTVIDLATGATTVVPVGDRPGAALISADGRRAYVDNYYDGTVSVIDTASSTVIGTVGGSSTPDIAFTPDGRFVYAVDQSPETGGVVLVSTADDTVTFIPASNISVFESVRFSPDGRYLFVESDDGRLVVVDLDGIGATAAGDLAVA